MLRCACCTLPYVLLEWKRIISSWTNPFVGDALHILTLLKALLTKLSSKLCATHWRQTTLLAPGLVAFVERLCSERRVLCDHTALLNEELHHVLFLAILRTISQHRR